MKINISTTELASLFSEAMSDARSSLAAEIANHVTREIRDVINPLTERMNRIEGDYSKPDGP